MLTTKKILTALLFTTLLAFNSHAGEKQYLFNTIEFKSKSLESLPKWLEILERMIAEKQKVNSCNKNLQSCDNKFISHWIDFIRQTSKIKDKKQVVAAVNTFFNDWEYILDIDNWGISDYWEIPSEFIEFSGDCEDYAIIKYYTLRTLGFKADELRIVILKDTIRNGAHAVLATYFDDEILILDNLSTMPLEDTILTQYVPYYSINENTKWLHFPKM
jgi:predicted transglutaminase-like cysteine proteinase|tara:strand:+ start:780 stop:1430 length:651 start_codon:yes stop_codon:yes gene_type:complete